jgi:NADH dehydrogenase [ubiquinone] 1 alpha subcomplex assembly factor 7
LHEPLENPGIADLTADVDFGYLRKCIGDKALAYGPVAQADFLEKLGIHVRLKVRLSG